MTTITEVVARDVRFPTSENLAGSDAMNQSPGYSAAYAVLKTDTDLEGHGLTFTIGRGNELCVAAIEALAPLVVGRTLESFTEDMGAFWRHATGDSQLRWVGPEKGVIHLATAAVVNAVWDLYAKGEGTAISGPPDGSRTWSTPSITSGMRRVMCPLSKVTRVTKHDTLRLVTPQER